MAQDDGDPTGSGWPAEGAALGEARRLIVDQELWDRLADAEKGRLVVNPGDLSVARRPDPREVAAARKEIEKQFLARLASGSYACTGRRGSPTAPRTDVPPAAWWHLTIGDLARSTAVEPDGTVWYEIRVRPHAEPATQAGSTSISEPGEAMAESPIADRPEKKLTSGEQRRLAYLDEKYPGRKWTLLTREEISRALTKDAGIITSPRTVDRLRAAVRRQ